MGNGRRGGKSRTLEELELIRKKVVELTRLGVPASQIGERLGICERQVCRYRRKAGITKPPPKRMTPEQIDTATKMLDDGASFAEVARTLGFTHDAILRRFPGRGWTKQQIGEYNSLRHLERRLLDGR